MVCLLGGGGGGGGVGGVLVVVLVVLDNDKGSFTLPPPPPPPPLEAPLANYLHSTDALSMLFHNECYVTGGYILLRGFKRNSFRKRCST